MNKKSVAKNQTNSKARNRKKSANNKNTTPFMMIPEQDLKWLKGQLNQVKELFIDCWISDPYGSRWMPLNHSLKPTSFKAAIKILDEAGLFLFRTRSSVSDRRETVCWEVFNLHGSRRRKQDWNTPDSAVSVPTSKVSVPTSKVSVPTLEVGVPTSISSENHTQSQSQKPSRTFHEHLTNSSKEFDEVCAIDPWDDDRDRDTAFEGRVTSASSEEEKRGQQPKNTGQEEQLETDSSFCHESCVKDISEGVVQKSSSEILNQEYIHNPQSQDAVFRSVDQNLAIEAEITTEEYQKSWSEVKARTRAIFEQTMKKKKDDRDRRLRGDRS